MRNFTATTPAGQTHVLTSAADVTEPQKSEAQSWPIWDSTEDFKAQKQPKFVLRYRLEERVLILSGSAQLSPTNGDPPFVVSAGDACTFRAGFVASWVVTSPMRKHYHYFDAAGELCAEPSKTTPVAVRIAPFHVATIPLTVSILEFCGQLREPKAKLPSPPIDTGLSFRMSPA
jgi:uncharacterized cupin superfamily protein